MKPQPLIAVRDVEASSARYRRLLGCRGGRERVVEPHVNPNARHRESWIGDPDGYVVVLAGPYGDLGCGIVDPALPDPELIEAGRLLFARECRFVFGATGSSAMPAETLPEIAFIGRSNVGKSSLINALTGRRDLARMSKTPGRTRQINFFDLGRRLMLVDLPGYGYAAASKDEIAQWTRLMQRYLQGRATLMRACLLIDSRHGILAADEPMMRLLDAAGLSYQVVLTKADKPRAAALAAVRDGVAAALATHGAAHPDILPVSAQKGLGIAELRAVLAAFAEVAPPRRAG